MPNSCKTALVLGILLTFVGLPPSVDAQGPPTLRLSLDDAISRALATSHRLAESRARETAARASVNVREAADRPTVSALASYTRTRHVTEFSVPGPTGTPRVIYPDIPSNYQSRLELRWPIYTGGRTDALERAAQAEADAASADVAVAQADLRLEVTRAYWALVTARATVGVLEEGVVRSQAHVTDVVARSRAGLVPPNELASATAQEARARMLAIEARTNRDVAKADLARLIDVDPEQPLEPTADLGRPPAEPVSSELGALIESAREHRRERQALQLRVTAAGEQKRAAAAGRRPTIQISSSVDYARPNARIFPRAERWDDFWDAGVGVSWPLWDGGRTSAEVAQATAVSQAASERLAEFDSILSVDVRQRTLEVQSTRAAIDAAESGVEAAAEARRVVGERYRAGVSSEIEVLDAEYALLQAQLDRTRAQASARLADARLSRSIGR